MIREEPSQKRRNPAILNHNKRKYHRRAYRQKRAWRTVFAEGEKERPTTKEIMHIYLDIFITFAKVGICTFGGGYAMLPILQREVVEKKKWAEDDELTDYFAIGQCTPGIIAVNTATFVGSRLKGIPGGILATLGVVTPSILIIIIIAACLSNFQNNPYIIHAFAGIRACVCVLILNAILKLRKSCIIDIPTALIFTVVFLVSVIFGFSPALIVVIAGILGLAISLSKKRLNAAQTDKSQKEENS